MIGKTISHYKIIEKLGEGGMGVIYKAHDTKLDRDVALKFLPVSFAASEEEIARFKQEARAISALNHPAIGTIHDFDEWERQKYLVLEYLPGGTLKSKLKQLKSEDRELSIDKVLDYGLQIAEGLAHAHRHQIIHRDLKTENMMLTEEGKVKLTDFGLAKLRGSVRITRTGSTLGTAAYMSPEQILGEEVDHRSDIFSLGVVLYELVTSQLPFRGEFEVAVGYAILHEDPPAIGSLRRHVPPPLELAINRCLEKDKTKRYQSAEEIVGLLRSVQQETTGRITMVAKRSRFAWIVAAGAVVLAIAGISLFHPRLTPPPAHSKWIAVLPFINLSVSQEDEYFADGITEDILTQLSKIADINVISRTTMMQYKGSKKPLREIGKELNAAVVLEGSVRHSGNRIRITSQLIDAKTDRHLWAEVYDRELQDVFAIQSEVAERIAAALKARLTVAEKERIEKKQTDDMEAYQLYLKGRFYWNKRNPADLRRALECYNEAIARDSSYALAYAGLASTYAILPEYSGLSERETTPKAETAALRALELDTTLAEAHAVLGLIRMYFEWDWHGAGNEYERAIELSPGNPTVRQWYSVYLCALGRMDEALAEIKRAQALDPLSPTISSTVGDVLYFRREYDKAIAQYKKTLELEPALPSIHTGLGSAYMEQGKFNDALSELQQVRALVGTNPYGLSDLGNAYARAGKRSASIKILDELLSLSDKEYSLAYDIALVYLGLGEKEKTFEWLERAYDERSIWLPFLKVAVWDSIRSDPRFLALVKRIGLAQ